jgi:hypothetical protein
VTIPLSNASFSDQIADTFYQQVIETEDYNIHLGSASKEPPMTIVDNDQHHQLKLTFYNPSDLHVS